jgi:hypothetical protein
VSDEAHIVPSTSSGAGARAGRRTDARTSGGKTHERTHIDTRALSLLLPRTPHVAARGIVRLVRMRDQLKCGEVRRPHAQCTSTMLKFASYLATGLRLSVTLGGGQLRVRTEVQMDSGR